jgi:hypothetical protein
MGAQLLPHQLPDELEDPDEGYAPRQDLDAAGQPRRAVIRARRALRPVSDIDGRAWLLDAVGMHDEFDELFTGLVDDGGLVPFRERVTSIWTADDDLVQSYLARLRVHAEDWEVGFEERHLAEWYRVLIAAYIEPVRGFASPPELKDELPDLGWTPADARRLTWGRELSELAAVYSDEQAAAALELVMRVGNKGWLSQDDIGDYLYRFQTMDPAWFRGAQHLVPLVEDAYAVLDGVAQTPDLVLLLPGA